MSTLPAPRSAAWLRERDRIATGSTTPRRRARALKVSIDRYLAWLYPPPDPVKQQQYARAKTRLRKGPTP